MKTFLGTAVLLAAGLSVTPALAATTETPAPVADITAQVAYVGDDACPVMTPSPALSDSTQGLFAIIANACKLKNAGLIEDYQFQMIRDQAVSDLMVQMQADADARMNQRFAANP